MADDKSMADRIIEPVKKAGEQVRAAGEKMMENSASVNRKVLDHAEKNAMEAFAAMRAASASARARSSCGATTSLISPQASAVAASMDSPVISRCIAWA